MARRSIEEPTLLERFVSIIPGPYWLSALIWSILLPSGLGFDLISIVATGKSPAAQNNLENTTLNLMFAFYGFLMLRYIRLRVVAGEHAIAPRLIGGQEDYHRTFGSLTQTLPPLLMALPLSFLLIYSEWINGAFTSAWILAPNIIVAFLGTLIATTYLWEFARASWGLHKLGGISLRLAPFLEDRMMGTKPLGNLALSLTVAYFGEILLAGLLFTTLPGFNLGTIAILAALLAIGIALFFLPLNSIHVRMRQEKHRLLHEIGARFPRLEKDPDNIAHNATLDDVRLQLSKLTDLQEVEMLDRKIAMLPTWPFDVNVVSKFIAIVVSVTAVLLTRLITDYLIHI